MTSKNACNKTRKPFVESRDMKLLKMRRRMWISWAGCNFTYRLDSKGPGR